MNDKAKYLITGFVIGAITVWFFTFIAHSSKNTSPTFQMGRGMMGNAWNSESSDKHFIEEMIPHHEDAVVMSELALERATRPEVIELAQNIITSQTKEIEQMKIWYKDWYSIDNVDEGYGMGYGMMNGHMDMMIDLDGKELEEAEDFDREFIEHMIPHHQIALMMVSMLIRNSDREEIRELGENIIEAQSSEIELMQGWLESWE